MTPSEALARIAALCDESGRYPTLPAQAFVRTVRKVLAEVPPGSDMPSPLTHPGDLQSSGPESYTSGGALDRDQARDVLFDYKDDTKDTTEALDALAACVRPAAIDRDALLRVLDEYPEHNTHDEVNAAADAILALMRPVAGVTLTPEEAALALRWKRDAVRHGYVIDIPDDDLTARLEAAQ